MKQPSGTPASVPPAARPQPTPSPQILQVQPSNLSAGVAWPKEVIQPVRRPSFSDLDSRIRTEQVNPLVNHRVATSSNREENNSRGRKVMGKEQEVIEMFRVPSTKIIVKITAQDIIRHIDEPNKDEFEDSYILRDPSPAHYRIFALQEKIGNATRMQPRNVIIHSIQVVPGKNGELAFVSTEERIVRKIFKRNAEVRDPNFSLFQPVRHKLWTERKLW